MSNELELLAELLLKIIRTKPGEPIGWKKLRTQTGSTQEELAEAARVLADWDYKLTVRTRAGITFRSAPDYLIDLELKNGLKTAVLGKTIHAYRSVGSTNDKAHDFARAGADHGTIVVAEEQTKGRGRLGRQWHSPLYTGAYQSIIVRPSFAPDQAPGLSVVAALALAETLKKATEASAQVKWPNDVLLNGRKVAGILTELAADTSAIDYVVIGVGVNLNQTSADFPPELRPIATSVRRTLKRKVSRIPLIQAFWKQLERELDEYAARRMRKSRSRLKKLSSLLGHAITLAYGGERVSGTVVDFADDGAMILKTDSGSLRISSGEVTIVKS